MPGGPTQAGRPNERCADDRVPTMRVERKQSTIEAPASNYVHDGERLPNKSAANNTSRSRLVRVP